VATGRLTQFISGGGERGAGGVVPQIDHVVVLALENRSFDHLLGYLVHPDPRFDGLLHGGPYANPGWKGSAPVTASPQGKPVLPVDPDHSHDAVMEQLNAKGKAPAWAPNNQGFVTSYERKGRGLAVPTYGGALRRAMAQLGHLFAKAKPAVANRGGLAMLSQTPQSVPALSKLALEFGVCTRWFASVPGETWPNRNFLHAATSDGETNIYPRFYDNTTIFELLEGVGKSWHIYHDDTPQVWAFPALWETPDRHANWFEFSEFKNHVTGNQLPAYAFIEPNHRPPLHTLDHAPIIGQPDVSNNQHPGNNLVDDAAYDKFTAPASTDFSRADQLITDVYEALRGNPGLFERTLLLITYDEHGGLFDHVPPPTGVAAPGGQASLGARLLRWFWYRKAAPFDFTMLGVRVPALVISPFVPAGTVSDQIHDHASVPATLRALFAPNAEPLNARDAKAAPFHSLLTLPVARKGANLPDLSGVLAAGPASATTRAPGAQPQGRSKTPQHYQDFVKLAKAVRRRLNRKLPERAMPKVKVKPTAPRVEKAQTISRAFIDEAKRVRETPATTQS
jgi:phospholipase C